MYSNTVDPPNMIRVTALPCKTFVLVTQYAETCGLLPHPCGLMLSPWDFDIFVPWASVLWAFVLWALYGYQFLVTVEQGSIYMG